MSRRLACIRSELGSDDVLIMTAFCSMQQSRDGAAPFLQEANFLWLTGIAEPDWRCIVTQDAFMLVAPDVSETQRIFEGGVSAADAIAGSGADKVLSKSEAQDFISSISGSTAAVYTIGEDPQADHYEFVLNPAQERLDSELRAVFKETVSLRGVFSRVRAIKSDYEIVQIRHAIDVTADAFDEVRKGLYDGRFTYEYEVEACFTAAIRSRGADGHAYEPIVASGTNALTLHYAKNNMKLPRNGLVLMDVGARAAGFAADITRTFAVGDVSAREREVHVAVESAHHEIISAIRPGLQLAEYQDISDSIMKKALGSLGLISNSDDALYRHYFPHAVSHGLGLDVHESLGGFGEFKEGMVLTVEPGIYIPEEGIGVRIEDDILVTKDGYENMSRRLSTGL